MKLIDSIQLKFGIPGKTGALKIKPEGITLFVGPNNSGKSLALREIERACASYSFEQNRIVDRLEFSIPDDNSLRENLARRQATPSLNESVPAGHILVQRLNTLPGQNQREIVPANQFGKWRESRNWAAIARYYMSLQTVRLDGETRTKLLNPAARGDLLDKPTNLLMALFLDRSARESLRRITSEAFGAYFVIDLLSNNLRARLSDRAPVDEAEEQALDSRARQFHSNSMEIVNASDGVKAFTGMLATVVGQDCRIPLIDEPEAFLHPPLARRLGKELAEAANNKDACVIAATHSADFLMGCVAGGARINIVRLTYKSGIATARLLENERLQEIIRSPFMRSTGVLSSLFHEGAVVCEGDSDRALYHELNDRLSTFEDGYICETQFINAHGKQMAGKIAAPLREMGIPAAVVLDFDIINNRTDFKNILNQLNIPDANIAGWCAIAAAVRDHCVEHSVDWKKRGISGIDDDATKQSALGLLNSLAEYGLFVVPNGTLETWLGYLEVPPSNNKTGWLLKIFESLGDNPDDKDNYALPKRGDVWDFLRTIANWINSPDRLGVV